MQDLCIVRFFRKFTGKSDHWELSNNWLRSLEFIHCW